MLVRANITVPIARFAPLIGRPTADRTGVDRRAARSEGHRPVRAAVVGQRLKKRVDIDRVRGDIVIDLIVIGRLEARVLDILPAVAHWPVGVVALPLGRRGQVLLVERIPAKDGILEGEVKQLSNCKPGSKGTSLEKLREYLATTPGPDGEVINIKV